VLGLKDEMQYFDHTETTLTKSRSPLNRPQIILNPVLASHKAKPSQQQYFTEKSLLLSETEKTLKHQKSCHLIEGIDYDEQQQVDLSIVE
jgi:hypothetical protein